MILYRQVFDRKPRINKSVMAIHKWNNQHVNGILLWSGTKWIDTNDGSEFDYPVVCWLEGFEIVEGDIHSIVCGRTVTLEAGLKTVDDIMDFLDGEY